MQSNRSIALLAGALAFGTAGCASMQDERPMQAQSMAAMQMDEAGVRSMLQSWPEASRKAGMDMMQKYGVPDGITPTMLTWQNNGPWKWTRLFKEEVPHNFPMPHPDVLEQAIDYLVPTDKFDDLARYDGSVIAERTKGQLSARCDKEGANFLAINLANDVATDRRSVEEARAYYAQAMQSFMQTNQMDPYMTGIRFQIPPGPQRDPGQAVIGGS